MSQHLRNLTLASAKHLLSQGHITPAHHARIVAKVGAVKRKVPAAPGFGSLAPEPPASSIREMAQMEREAGD